MSKATQASAITSGSTQEAAAMSPGKGLLILAAVVVVVGVFLALSHALGVGEVWAAFLFLLYWAGIEHAAIDKLGACIVGAALGLLMGYLLQTLPVVLGSAGIVVFLGAVLLLVYLQIMGWALLAVNMMTMLFLTVTTIPAIQTNVNFTGAFLALAFGIAYFAGLVRAGHWWQIRSSRN